MGGRHWHHRSPAGQTVALSGRSLINNGTLTLASGGLEGDSGAVLSNTGTLVVNGGSNSFPVGSGGALLYNTGTLTTTLTTGTTELDALLLNRGNISTNLGGGQIRFLGQNADQDGDDDNADTQDPDADAAQSQQQGAACGRGLSALTAFRLNGTQPLLLLAGQSDAVCTLGATASGSGYIVDVSQSGLQLAGSATACSNTPECAVNFGVVLAPGQPGYADPDTTQVYQGYAQFTYSTGGVDSNPTNPLTIPPNLATIPAPKTGETWSQYEVRLSQLGIKHIQRQILDNNAADPTQGAGAVTAVEPAPGTQVNPATHTVLVTTNPDNMRVIDLAHRLETQNPGQVDDTTRWPIAETCLSLEDKFNGDTDKTGDINDISYVHCANVPIFVSGLAQNTGLPSAATEHDIDAISAVPQWVQLNYEAPATKSGAGSWYRNIPPCFFASKVNGTQCDEFPFFSTQQGGPLASVRTPPPDLRVIAAGDNQSQGGSLSNFYTSCSMNTGIPQGDGGNALGGDAFLIVPIATGVPTMGLCNGKTSPGNPYNQPWWPAPSTTA